MSVLKNLIRSMYDFQLYREITKKSFARAFLHVLVIVIIYAIAFTIFAHAQALTPLNEFVVWAEKQLPEFQIQNKQITAQAQEPYFVTYEPLDLKFVFSTKQPFADLTSLEPNTILVEKERLLFIGTDQQYQEYDLAQLQEIPEDAVLTVNAQTIGRFKNVINGWFSPVVFIGAVIANIIFYLSLIFILGIIGKIFCLLFSIPLSYINACKVFIYSLTITFLIFIIGFFVPILVFPFRNVLLLLITILYGITGLVMNKGEQSAQAA